MAATADTAPVPAYACETVPTVNAAMFDATGWRAMAVPAFSAAARSADGQPSHREHHYPGLLRVRPSPPAVGPTVSTHRRAILGWANAQRRVPA